LGLSAYLLALAAAGLAGIGVNRWEKRAQSWRCCCRSVCSCLWWSPSCWTWLPRSMMAGCFSDQCL